MFKLIFNVVIIKLFSALNLKMGTLMDLNKSSTHDYVDNPYWSVFQVRVKYLLHNVYINNHLEQL
jgi:hypothetical protein